MKKPIFLILAAVILSGCAKNHFMAPEAKAVFQELKHQKIAVKSHFCLENINYLESLYRVLWVQENRSSQDFSGIWPDSAADFSGYTVAKLRKQGYDAQSVYDFMADKSLLARENRSLTPLCKQYAMPVKSQIEWGWSLPAESFFKLENVREFSPLAESLRQQNYNYLIEIVAMGVNAGSSISTIVSLSPNIRLIDVTNNKVISSFSTHVLTQEYGSSDLRELETDNMRKLKDLVSRALETINFAYIYDPD